MHNERMLIRAASGLLSATLLLTACSGDEGSEKPAGDGSPAAGESPSNYLDVPEGVDLTAQGSELALGESATVAYTPRQDKVAALDLTVRSIDKASFKLFEGWKLDPATRKTTPYFVKVTVANVGDLDLGGRRVPVYGVDGNNMLIESSTFASTFKPCPSESLPKKFRTGDTFKTCLVYLAPDKGELTAASFRPAEEFDPIVWTGEVGKAGAQEKGDKDGKGKKDTKGKKGKKKNKKGKKG